MNKALLFFLLAVCWLTQQVNSAGYDVKWKVAKAKFGLGFKSAQDERKAFNTYAKNMEMIEKKNSLGTLSYELGENHLTHLTEKEIQQKYLVEPGLLTKIEKNNALKVSDAIGIDDVEVAKAGYVGADTTTPKPIPDTLDYSYAFVEAKQQGECGACYAFSAVKTILWLFLNFLYLFFSAKN